MAFDNPSGCLIWPGTPNAGGYGRITVNGKRRYAHRVAYETFVGPIPDGVQIDHLCRVRLCVNPDHLEAVPPRINTLRGVGATAANARKECCPRGHSLEDAYRSSGRRECRTCKLARVAARYRGSRDGV